MNKEIFREYDVRGLVNRDLTDGLVYDLGRAVGTFALSRGAEVITLGRDTRLSSPEYLNALQRGLLATGINTLDCGLIATPMLYFSIRHLNAGGGVMVTGSHNPPEFNGFKICIGHDTIYGEDIQALRQIMEQGRYASGNGICYKRDIAFAYENHLFKNIRIERPIKVAVDGGNGVAGIFALPLYKRFQCEVQEIYCNPDGNFPNHFPDPTVVENLQDLIKLVKDTGSEAGIGFDGDGDRIGVVTDEGRIIWGDELLLLFSRFILKEHPGAAVIGEVKCSQKLFDDIAKNGGRAIMWKAGHSLIKGKMKEEKALLAGEMSGHIFFADRYFGYDDAIYASLRLIEILSRSDSTLTELLADVPPTFSTPELRVDCPDEIKFSVVEKVKAHFKKNFPVIDIDGVRVIFPGGWGLLRASNTQPVLVMRFEANREEELERIRETVESVVKDNLYP